MLALILLFPLLGFLINGIWYAFFQSDEKAKKASAQVTGAIATGAIFCSFLVSLFLFIKLQSLEPAVRYFDQIIFSWIKLEGFNLNFSLRFDPLSSLFCMVITGVGSLIHLYSIGYMSDDKTPGKYFAYLNLFCFAMLVLVTSTNLPGIFLGWEGVGLCSYLLIGYWYDDIEKAKAGKKAFIVNRVGDLGFLLGMFFIFSVFSTFEISVIQTAISEKSALSLFSTVELTSITIICLLLFVGCIGKSAQIPLYVWLPDAMAGPTPVSALIHAATMVTGGVYLISRLNFLYVLSPVAMEVVAWVGGLTALFAATIAIAQTDIKKVLAYSTVSQLGYMFLACGVGAFGAGVFHVITHAFFKALLFLGAGSVIHGLHHEQDAFKMGGLKLKMPQTYLVFGAAFLAICGIPPFSGFFSKDEVLWKTFSSPNGSNILWVLGMLTAVMTAFYMTRLFSLTFLGEHRANAAKAHESPKVMIYPLYVLAFLSVIGGFIGVPHFNWLEHWLSPVISTAGFEAVVPHSYEWLLMALSVLGASVGIFLGFKTYKNFSGIDPIEKHASGLFKTLTNKWYVDEIYEFLIIKPLLAASKFCWKIIDVALIDWVVLGFGRASFWVGQSVRPIQTGSVQFYLFMMLIGLLITLGYIYVAVV